MFLYCRIELVGPVSIIRKNVRLPCYFAAKLSYFFKQYVFMFNITREKAVRIRTNRFVWQK